MNDAPILYALADGVATITLNRPAQRNALSVQMRDEIAALLPRISHPPAQQRHRPDELRMRIKGTHRLHQRRLRLNILHQ